MVQDQQSDASMDNGFAFSTTERARFRMDRTTARSRRGLSQRCCRLLPRSSCRLSKVWHKDYPEITNECGFKCSYKPTFTSGKNKGWVSKGYYGLDQGPIVMMIENYRTGLIWRLMRRCPVIVDGLRRAGFRNGWLG